MYEQRKNLIHYIIPALLGNISMFILTIVDGMFVENGVCFVIALSLKTVSERNGIVYR